MGLSFLAPAALALAAFVALPILAHMARQVPRERRAFGAMLLLDRVVKRLRRRRRLKDPLLLLLRARIGLRPSFADIVQRRPRPATSDGDRNQADQRELADESSHDRKPRDV